MGARNDTLLASISLSFKTSAVPPSSLFVRIVELIPSPENPNTVCGLLKPVIVMFPSEFSDWMYSRPDTFAKFTE